MTDYRPPLSVLLVLLVPASPALAQDKSPGAAPLTTQARRVLETFCHRCHNGEGSESGADFDVLKRATLVGKRGPTDKVYLTPGKPAESYLWDRIADNTMPKRRSPERDNWRPEHKEILRQWIEAGAPDFPKEEARPAVSLLALLSAIRDDLNKTSPGDRPYLRYFTLTHLHNNPAVSADHLRLVRAALAKALNSLSWEQVIVRPRAVDPAGTVLAVDIRKLGWNRDHWRAILQAYPYGLLYDSHPDPKLQDVDGDIRRLTDRAEEYLVHVRADWFVATATRPPLYHALLYDLYLPVLRKRPADPKDPANPKRMTARDLEDFLHVEVLANLLASDPRARRAGFAKSGVSGHNRLIERHPLKAAGAYWLSYDFKASTWEANLLQFPLGPRFDRNPFSNLAFVHDGGEAIFHLPNGLQGYLLVDGKGGRIDAGPIDVVSDALKTAGTPAIVNGLSCMACHKHGMIDPPKDLVRDGAGVFGQPRERVRQLYPEPAELAQLVRRDADQFLRALEEAVGAYLLIGPDKGRPVKELPEPVGEVARKYLLEDLDVTAAASELFEEPKRLRQQVVDSDRLRNLGLGALGQDGGLIKRSAWEAFRGSSQMQQAARVFGYSTLRVVD